MKLAIVGNNDGPLVLLKSLQNSNAIPVAVGLQKTIRESLKIQYREFTDGAIFFQGFDEDKLLKQLEKIDFDILINCFCNF